MDARERVLGAVRAALGRTRDSASAPPDPQPWTAPSEPVEDPAVRFAAELEAVDGRFLDARTAGLEAALREVADETDARGVVVGPGLDADLAATLGLDAVDADAAARAPAGVLGVVRAQAGISSTGSVLIAADGAHAPSLVVEDAVVVLAEGDLMPDLQALQVPTGRVRTHILITGPSRTADIEKRLVLGAHGPIRHWVVLVR